MRSLLGGGVIFVMTLYVSAARITQDIERKVCIYKIMLEFFDYAPSVIKKVDGLLLWEFTLLIFE